jgi:hypothetical protein
MRYQQKQNKGLREQIRTVIYNPILLEIWTLDEAGMANTISLFVWVLIEHAPIILLLPIVRVHGVLAYEFQLAETVVAVVRATAAVDDELLVSLWVGELLRSLVGG